VQKNLHGRYKYECISLSARDCLDSYQDKTAIAITVVVLIGHTAMVVTGFINIFPHQHGHGQCLRGVENGRWQLSAQE
jgi:hypothetical protein